MDKWIFAAALLAAATSIDAAEIRTIPVKGVVRESLPISGPRRFDGPGASVGHVPSVRNILGLDRAHRFSLPTAASAARQKTVNVAVLRVQFKQELPDDPNTTGDGHLDLRDPAAFFAEEGHSFEQAPHNAEFFSTVMRAMAQYYGVVSNGRLTVSYDIFPTALDGAYTLDSSMCWYGGRDPNTGLAELLIDAVTLADADPDILFASYDAVILFHAGSDRQHDFSPVTPTPCDLFTAYVRLLDSAIFIPVDNGTSFVSDGVILPETATQDNRGSGLNGIVAHEFGHALGLPDIYSTRTGFTQVGNFSLMDNDAQEVGIAFDVPWEPSVFFDLLPVFPDAWSRAYLGFADVVNVLPDSIVARDDPNPDLVQPYFLAAAEGTNSNLQILRVPITSKEYFLVEFRSPDQDLNVNLSQPGDQGVGIRFDSTFNAVLGPATCNPDPTIPAEIDSCRVLGRDYDFQIFDSGDSGGVLIWHVDEEVAYQLVPELEGDAFFFNNYQANTLQWDPVRRFLEIEEADGLVDFGGRFFTYFGGQRELFKADYNDEFGLQTNPSTRSHTGAASRLEMFDISAVYAPGASPGNLPLHHMQLKFRLKNGVSGWPRSAGVSPAPELTVLRGGEEDTIFASSGPYVLAWSASGNPLWSQLPGDLATHIFRRFDDSLFSQTLSGFAKADTTLATQPSIGTDFADSLRWVSAVDVLGKVYIWTMADLNADGWADLDTSFTLSAPAPQPPLWFDADGDLDEEMFVASSDGGALVWEDGVATMYGLGVSDVRDWTYLESTNEIYVAADMGLVRGVSAAGIAYTNMGLNFESLVSMDSDRDSTDELYARSFNVLYKIALTPAPRVELERDPVLPLHGPLTSGDPDNDGRPSLLVGAGDRLAAFQPNLTLERDYPLRGNDRYSADPVSEAVTADDATFFGGADGEVQGYDSEGLLLNGWPLFSGDTIVSLAILRLGADTSAADTMLVLARSSNGYIWASRQPGSVERPGAWTQSRGGMAKQNRWNSTGAPPITSGGASLSVETVYAYPNPAPRGPVTIRYFLDQSSPVDFRIYDLGGNQVGAGATAGIGGMDNEWIWDASGMAPGVYYCRVEATAGGSGVIEFCKIAIIP